MRAVGYFIPCCMWLLSGCMQPVPVLFEKLSAEKTGVNFVNTINETEDLNILTYEYIYNGGGVAIGDLNGDGLPDLYLTSNMNGGKLYLNKGGMKFEDITLKAGVAGRDSWKTGVSMADVNGDGLLDIYICYSGPGADEARKNELYINQGALEGYPSFKESAMTYGLDAQGAFTTQCVFFDFDRDGDLDAFLVNHADMFYNAFVNTSKLRRTRHPRFGSRLYRNDNNRFTDISIAAGIFGSGLNFGLGCAVGDLNEDGWPDLYVSNDYNEQDYLYLNHKDGTFKEVLQQSMGHISKYSMGCNIDDYNNDLRQDVISLDMLPEDNKRQKLLKGPDAYDVYTLLVDSGFHYQNMRNMLQLNVSGVSDSIPQFSEIGQMAGISNTDWSWSPLMADFDNDGWKDLFITNGFLRDFTNLDFYKYYYQEKASSQRMDKSKSWELIKKLPSTLISNVAFTNDRQLGFQNQTNEWGLSDLSVSTGAACADLDNDGDIDLVVNNINQPAFIYENNADKLLSRHFIKIQLIGPKANTFGVGAKVIVTTDSGAQVKELYPTRGFQSSTEPVLHFGLGNAGIVRSVQIMWPDGKISGQRNCAVDTSYVFNHRQAEMADSTGQKHTEPFFSNATETAGIAYRHIENTGYVDFKTQSLLPWQISKQGPFLTKGDVNGDGYEDVFIGGNERSPASLFLQQADGRFGLSASQPWATGYGAKDAGVALLDVDGDKDLDLFITKGGTEFPAGDTMYQAALYRNDGKGGFKKLSTALPVLTTNAGSVAAADYDKDGDVDLYIGSLSVPGRYPVTPESFLLRNESKGGQVHFAYAPGQPDQQLKFPGLVTTAIWADINNDSWPDLLVAGQFMPVTVFENTRGILHNATHKYGLQQTSGLWCKLVAEDMDDDGDTDIIAGNIGLNNSFHATTTEPVSICYSDFDHNGSIDPLFCGYIQGKNYCYFSLDDLVEQLPVMRKKFPRYEDYSNTSFANLFTAEEIRKATTITAVQLASCYLENKSGVFITHPLPAEAQFSTIYGIATGDWDNDGKKDMLVCGNFYFGRAEWGRMDAGRGQLLTGNGKGVFTTVSPEKSGLHMDSDLRDMIAVSSHDGNMLVATTNNGNIEIARKNTISQQKIRK